MIGLLFANMALSGAQVVITRSNNVEHRKTFSTEKFVGVFDQVILQDQSSRPCSNRSRLQMGTDISNCKFEIDIDGSKALIRGMGQDDDPPWEFNVTFNSTDCAQLTYPMSNFENSKLFKSFIIDKSQNRFVAIAITKELGCLSIRTGHLKKIGGSSETSRPWKADLKQ